MGLTSTLGTQHPSPHTTQRHVCSVQPRAPGHAVGAWTHARAGPVAAGPPRCSEAPPAAARPVRSPTDSESVPVSLSAQTFSRRSLEGGAVPTSSPCSGSDAPPP